MTSHKTKLQNMTILAVPDIDSNIEHFPLLSTSLSKQKEKINL